MQEAPLTPRLTVLVFKENLVARSFQIPLSWITRFGVVISSLVILATGATILAVKYYRVAERSDTGRVEDLERELDTLRSAYQALEVRAAQVPPLPATPVSPLPADPAQLGQAPAAPTGGTGTQAPGADSAPETAASSGPLRNLLPLPISSSSQLLFTALPAEIQPPPADPSALAIRIHNPKLQWVGKKLRVGFAIQYVRADGGSQQGRILILGRGPDTVVAYPEGAVGAAGSPALLNPDRGEYFSVGRYREVRADFPAVASESSIKTVEVLLLSQSGQVLIYDRIDAPVTKAPAKPAARAAPAPKAAASTESNAPAAPAAPAAPEAAPAAPGGSAGEPGGP